MSAPWESVIYQCLTALSVHTTKETLIHPWGKEAAAICFVSHRNAFTLLVHTGEKTQDVHVAAHRHTHACKQMPKHTYLCRDNSKPSARALQASGKKGNQQLV